MDGKLILSRRLIGDIYRDLINGGFEKIHKKSKRKTTGNDDEDEQNENDNITKKKEEEEEERAPI